MKVLLLSDTYSEHTEKWALGLANSGIEVGLFSFNKASYEWYEHQNITVFFEPDTRINAESTLTKLSYLKYVTILKKIIKHFQPDILHAHYATSYGLVGALSGFHPFIISSWGTDVMKFPKKNFVAKSILKYNFKHADLLCATSHTIKSYIAQVTKQEVTVIPFGIDLEVFTPKTVTPLFNENDFVIGSIKPLESLYNIDVLIKSFATASQQCPELKLLIIGEGQEENALKKLSEELGLGEKIKFTGRIPFEQISNYYNAINVLANISEYESFGVSVIEAMACKKPVIVTNVGGLAEIVKDDSLGIKVDIRNEAQTTEAILKLVKNTQLYSDLANNARIHVEENYNWANNLNNMIEIYNNLALTNKKLDTKTGRQ
ncbi:MAG: glycosyltransferase, partial [Bacteroidia bacterium]|nr:glycosyltransferase [Bacteroidia bacterium]